MVPRCPSCRHRLFQVGDDGVKLRTNIIIFNGDGATVKCPACKADVPLDLQLGDGLRKDLNQPVRKLIVRKVLDDQDSAK